MSDIWVANNGSAGGNGSRSMPYDITTGFAATSTYDRILLRRGIYVASAVVASSDITIEGADGLPILYGGAAITGTWSLHSGDIWRISKASAPLAIVLRGRSREWWKGEKKDNLGEVATDLDWYHTGGYLYLHAGEDPSVRFYRVDATTLTGTNGLYAGGLAYGGLYLHAKNNVTLRGIACYGWYENGILADDCTGLTVENCEASFNAGDGCGGFGLVDYTSIGGERSWNGERRVRIGETVLPDGDGDSIHNGLVPSTNFRVSGVRFVGNCKDAVQNIEGSTGVVEGCYIDDCAAGLIHNATTAQTYRNNTVVATARCPAAFVVINVGTATLYNNTFIGANTSAVAAVLYYFGVGTVVAKNNCLTEWAIGVAPGALGTWTGSYTNWNVTTRGVSLGTGDVTADPQLIGTRYGIDSDSPIAFVGTDLSATFTNDRFGRGRISGQWSIGAVEVVDITPRGRVLSSLCDALEAIGSDGDDWQTTDAVTGVVRIGGVTGQEVAPFIELTKVDETYERVSTGGIYARTMTVEFKYVAEADPQAFDWLGAISHDVELAIGRDRTLGGVCDDATFVSNSSSVDAVDSAMTFNLQISYRTQDTDPLLRV